MVCKIPSSIIDLFHIEDVVEKEIVYVEPKKLICKERLDIIAKYIYIDLKDKCSKYAKKIYLEHIRSMTRGSFVEPYSEKKKPDDFIIEFEKLIDDIRKNGFNEKSQPIFVDEKYHILDGAHRVAICLYFNIEVPVVVLPVKGEYNLHDQQYFENSMFDQEYLDLIIQYYLKLTAQNILCLNIWPSAIGHEEELKRIINNDFEILYKKQVDLNENGAFYYLAQIYKEYSWAQEGDNEFSGIYRKMLPCFPSFSPVSTCFLIPRGQLNLIEKKDEMRSLFNLGKHSLHMTDNLRETIEMGEIILSNNTINFINRCDALKYKSTLKWLKEALALKCKYNNEVCICGSIVLALYGIREAHDVDYLCLKQDEESHNKYIELYDLTLKESIYRPDIHFNFFGVSFLTLDREKIFKKNRKENKDVDDIKLIELFESGNSVSNKMRYLQIKRRMIAGIQGKLIRIAHATGTFAFIRIVYRRFKGKKD